MRAFIPKCFIVKFCHEITERVSLALQGPVYTIPKSVKEKNKAFYLENQCKLLVTRMTYTNHGGGGGGDGGGGKNPS